MSRSLCPLCSRITNNLESIEVCATCHRNLDVAANTQVASTGEFSVSELMNLAEASRAEPATIPAPLSVTCAFCGRESSQVRKLLSQGQSHICNACVGLCAAILQAELGDDWAN